MERAPGKFDSNVHRVRDGYERVLLTTKPTVDTARRTTFTLKHPHNSHMSTVAWLERKYRVYAWDADENTYAEIDDDTRVIINQPGFALQSIMENASIRFASTVINDKPHEWLPWYQRLYRQSLESCIRKSGRAFGTVHANDELDNTIRRTFIPRNLVKHDRTSTTTLAHLDGFQAWDMEQLTDNDLWAALGEHRMDLDTDDAVAAATAHAEVLYSFVQKSIPEADRLGEAQKIVYEYHTAAAFAIQQDDDGNDLYPGAIAIVARLQPFIDAITAAEDIRIRTPRVSLIYCRWLVFVNPPGAADLEKTVNGVYRPPDGDDPNNAETVTRVEVEHAMQLMRWLTHMTHPEEEQVTTSADLYLQRYNTGTPHILFDGEAAASSFRTNDEAYVQAADRDTADVMRVHLMRALKSGMFPRTIIYIFNYLGMNESPYNAAQNDRRTAIFTEDLPAGDNDNPPAADGPGNAKAVALFPVFGFAQNVAAGLDAIAAMDDDDYDLNIGLIDATATKVFENNYVDITFSEPLVIGMHAARQVGCWAGVGDVLPRVEDDTFYDFLWKPVDDLFVIVPEGFETMRWEFVEGSTVLRTTHYRGQFDHLFNMDQIQLPTMDFVLHRVDPMSSINIRTTWGPPQYLMFFTKYREHRSLEAHTMNQATSIATIQLRLNSGPLVTIDACDDHTSMLFPEYMPTLGLGRGNMLVLPWTSLPDGVSGTTDAFQTQQLTCQSVTFADYQDFDRAGRGRTTDVPDNVDLYCVSIYKDKFVQIRNHVQRRGWAMSTR